VLQADRPEDVAGEIRKALKYIPADHLIVSSDCGFGRQGCNREIAFYKASAIAQAVILYGASLVFRKRMSRPQTRCCRWMWFRDAGRKVGSAVLPAAALSGGFGCPTPACERSWTHPDVCSSSRITRRSVLSSGSFAVATCCTSASLIKFW